MKNIWRGLTGMAAALAVAAVTVPAYDVHADETNAAYAAFGVSGAECVNMSAENTGSPDEIAEEHDGETGWRIATSGGRANIRCKIDDDFIYELDGSGSVIVEVRYFDDSYGGFCLYYDSMSGPKGETVQLENSGTWKTKVFKLYDAYFGNNIYTDDLWITTNRPDFMGVSSDPVLIGSVRIEKNEKDAPFVISAETEKTGNIFFEGDEIKFNITYDNIVGKEYDIMPEYIVRDYNGDVLNTVRTKLAAAPSASESIQLGKLPYGIYTLEVKIEDANVEQSYVTDFSYVRKADETNYHFGMNIHYDDEEYNTDDIRNLSDLMKNSGFGFVRSSLRWNQIESEKGVYSIPDNIRESAVYLDKIGLELLGTVYIDNDLYASPPYYDMDDDALEAFKKYCEYTAGELGEYVDHYCMLNEINHLVSGYVDNEEEYVRIAKAGYEGIKAGDPDDSFINGGALAGWSRDYAKKTYELGILDYCDSYSMHIYDHLNGPETDWMFRSEPDHKYWLDYYDTTGTKQAWITESGWPTRTADDTSNESASRAVADAHDSSSEIEQAQWYTRSMAINSDKDRIDKFFYYALCDNDIDRFDIQSNFGILHSKNARVPFSAKPAYAAVCAFSDIVGCAEFEEDEITDGSGWAYRFKRADGSNVTCVWGAECYGQTGIGSTYRYTSEAPYILLYDMYGNEQYIENVNGYYDIPIEEEPVYAEDAEGAPGPEKIKGVSQEGIAKGTLEAVDPELPINVLFPADAQEGSEAAAICAAYSDGILIGIETAEAVVENGEVSCSFGGNMAEEADTLKFMILHDLKNMQPVSRCFVLYSKE